ncbi:hypothetical protein AVEN_29855-1 [Araneus ventricosus]|uniref:Uncharacterized protein n=1 Tax=Araneus ventricosus TaxID=182803 RepID=A0A4Y2JMT8_ARAVE|nr:hypothetical protein AVEN_29855-1 [Araneus ventricosus]
MKSLISAVDGKILTDRANSTRSFLETYLPYIDFEENMKKVLEFCTRKLSTAVKCSHPPQTEYVSATEFDEILSNFTNVVTFGPLLPQCQVFEGDITL